MKPIVLFTAFLVVAAPAAAQDQLRLRDLQQEAVERDQRMRQIELREAATERRVRNIGAERLPVLTLVGQAHYQSEVPSVPIDEPGISIPEPPNSRYEGRLDVEQLLYDSGRLGRERAVEEAELRTELARITADLIRCAPTSIECSSARCSSRSDWKESKSWRRTCERDSRCCARKSVKAPRFPVIRQSCVRSSSARRRTAVRPGRIGVRPSRFSRS